MTWQVSKDRGRGHTLRKVLGLHGRDQGSCEFYEYPKGQLKV